MTPVNDLVVIHLEVASIQGLDLLRQSLKHLREFLDLDSISSIFRMDQPKAAESERPLVLAVAGSTSLAPRELVAQLKGIESEVAQAHARFVLSARLLFYGQAALMTPEVTVPYPDLHLRPALLGPAMEVAREWHHPVLRTELRRVAEMHRMKAWGQFVAQGKSVLDFSESGG